ncbi:hypothetical protein [Tenacibaculum finnmarkense]|uniref:hypothetical protein n=1 Tax=Tenacibaculum finnmarkense TaxID=2781243 RepID=UPI001EFA7F75|nr:hypothetical protein [Tenacibaculum finnmarkense]MCG8206558.1 hypothetical protein [Tenacibaculum finnmarkense genomovar finnmarkense]MCG8722673.1 hypothetical protein [Tenacibaculum finnmarkense]MCG8741002.1 hypothetical protein [Tenacibaculum finnmarkense]MCG8764271.1 hypothetical protein [Tenacibaculum finnmarkense]MCG8777192.1 hypothetical protein [Tenacibaculum finnmarkense]
MPKLIVVLGIFLINQSCQKDDDPVINSKINGSNILLEAPYHYKKTNNFTFDNILKNAYLTKIKPNNNVLLKAKNKNIFGDSFNIKMNISGKKNNYFQGVKVFENLSLPNDFTNTSLLIKFPYIFGDKEINVGFLIRVIKNEKKEKRITEIISVLTGKVISYTLEGVLENEYLKLKKLYDVNTQVARPSDPRPSDPTICFTNFKNCFDRLSYSNGSPLSQTLCEWGYCKTIAYLSCQFLDLEGQIEESCNFKGCNYCDIILGSTNGSTSGLTTKEEPIDLANHSSDKIKIKLSQVVRSERKKKDDPLSSSLQITLPKFFYLLKKDIGWVSDTEHKLYTNLPIYRSGYKYYKIIPLQKGKETSLELVINKYVSPEDLIITSIKGDLNTTFIKGDF